MKNLILCIAFIFLFTINYSYTSSFNEVEDTLDKKILSLASSLSSSKILWLNEEKYNKYIVQSPRNYSVILMMTALGARYGCKHCQPALDEFHTLITAFYNSDSDKTRLFFAVADYDEASEVFTALEQSTVPVIIHFPPNSKPENEDIYDVSRNGIIAESLGQWIAHRIGIHFKIERPPNVLIWVLVSLIFGVFAFILYKLDSLTNLFTRTSVSYTCMAIIFGMISGQMWNSIRNPPAFHSSSEGGLVFFYPSSNSQFVSESVIVMIVYALVSWSIVILIEAADVSDASRKRVMMLTGLTVFAIFISLCFSLFRKKHQAYPFV